MRCKTLGDSKIHTALVNVGNGHCRATRLPGHSCGKQADSARPQDQGRGARSWLRSVHGMDSNRERLKQSSGFERDVVGESAGLSARLHMTVAVGERHTYGTIQPGG